MFRAMGGTSALVNEAVAEAVAAWLPAWGLPVSPVAGVKDLKGQGIRVAKFTDDATSRFFFPRRTLGFQQRMTKAITMSLRKRGAKIISVPLTIEDYARWQQSQDKPDSAELRFRFATRPPELP
jgi:hypothetical protein